MGGVWRSSCLRAALALLPALAVAQAETDQPRCRHYNPLRTAYFGDLHVHTALSLDAAMQDTRTLPADAYRFARGEAIGIPPYADDGTPLRTARIDRPLDFAAVTDHAEMLGESYICHTPGQQGYDSLWCVALRWVPRWAGILFSKTASEADRLGFCGDDGELCRAASRGPWQDIQSAARAAQDTGEDCSFTTFVGYEWTGAAFTPENLVANLHRNVIFRNDSVPELPISFVESKDAPTLYRQLDQQCRGAGKGCDAVVIPHNSNISLGLMFRDQRPDGRPLSADDARLQARYETLVEIIQHKGASECYYGANPVMAQDELCAFEQLPWNSFAGNTFERLAQPITPGAGMAREVLHQGLQLQGQLGANPFRFGFIGSTDTHRALAGGVEEAGFQGHGGAGNAGADAAEVATRLPDQWEFNPGGLAVLYAEQNTREALFAAMQRREAYATSGPRLQLRFFGGAGLAPELCGQPDMLAQAYANGVPMGGDLLLTQAPPRFLVAAAKDPGIPGRPGNDLQRLQVIKGWVDDDGRSREQVFDVAGNPDNGAGVDLSTCEPTGTGAAQLCTVWEDPAFDPALPAFYYARAVENPGCRWTTRVCNALAVDCSAVDELDPDTAMCCSAELPKTVQERAWSSPIWYTPVAGEASPPAP